MCKYALKPEDFKDFILAGDAIFSVRNKNTGKHMTFKVVKKKYKEGKEEDPKVWWVMVCIGSNEFTYLGVLTENGFLCKANTDSAIAFRFLMQRYVLNLMPKDNVELFHEGKCPYCGRPMTDPASLERGMGPVCAQRIKDRRQSYLDLMHVWRNSL